jgi:hypothetical protein
MPERRGDRGKTRARQRPVAEEIAELRSLTVPELVVRYEAVFGQPPRVKHRDWLWRRIAWKIQEQRFGGLSQVARRRLDELILELDLPLLSERTVREKAGRPPRKGDPPVGTTISRVWNGREIVVTAVDGGWEHDAVVYRSLSAAAQAVTGSHWNGRLFFGLIKKRQA